MHGWTEPDPIPSVARHVPHTASHRKIISHLYVVTIWVIPSPFVHLRRSRSVVLYGFAPHNRESSMMNHQSQITIDDASPLPLHTDWRAVSRVGHLYPAFPDADGRPTRLSGCWPRFNGRITDISSITSDRGQHHEHLYSNRRHANLF